MSKAANHQHIVACDRKVDIGTPVVLWNHRGGYPCPHPRGRKSCRQHDTELNDGPTQSLSQYQIHDPEKAYQQLTQTIHQFVLHYDVCFTSWHCHQVLKQSPYMGSHFYLDLDGTIYQTCDLYWKTNTAPADDRRGNDRAIHVEMANLSWQALAEESDLFRAEENLYTKVKGRWRLNLPEKYRKHLRNPQFEAFAARAFGDRGYFSRTVNGKVVRMWDFTEQQYQALIRLCIGVNQLLPQVSLKVPLDPKTHRTPLKRLRNFSTFKGVLGHHHVQSGTNAVKRKYDPGSAFDWSRLRREFERHVDGKR